MGLTCVVSHWQRRQHRLKNARGRTAGLKRVCTISSLTALCWGCGNVSTSGGEREKRGFLIEGLATPAFKDIWVKWLTAVFHSRHPRRSQLRSSFQASPRLECTCAAFPMTGPSLAPVQGLQAVTAQGRAPGGLQAAGGFSSGPLLSPTCPFLSVMFPDACL